MKTANSMTQIRLKNVLLATDLSEASIHATRYAISLAARYGGKLYAAHVISPDALALAHPEALDRILKETNDYTERTLGELLAPARRQGLPCEALVGVGDITNVLAEFVEKYKADLVIVGTSGRAGLGKVFLGSVAEEIIRDAACPVLTVGANASGMTAARYQKYSLRDRFLARVSACFRICLFPGARAQSTPCTAACCRGLDGRASLSCGTAAQPSAARTDLFATPTFV